MSDDVMMDWDRFARTGVPEAVLCSSKSMSQLDAIIAMAANEARGLLLTRLDHAQFDRLDAIWRARVDYDEVSRTGILAGERQLLRAPPPIGVVAAGSSDLPVAREAVRTLQFHGAEPLLIIDVGVAGLWRLTKRLPEIERCAIVIAVAGMEGALFSVLAGLVRAPIIAVPTSVGYGVSAGGRVALGSALASCAPGLVVVNVDNGFGAACAAVKMAGIGR